MAAYLGIDVGTGSARAGVFDATGKMLGQASREITIWRPEPDFVEQSSDEIWNACCGCVAEAMQQAGILADEIKGVGFDATCSLVALDADDNPVTISPSGQDEQNVIVWMDHRAIPQAERILVCSSYLARNDLDTYGPPEKVVPCETWGKVLLHLMESYPKQAKVAVYPYAAIQLPPAESD